MEGSHSGLVRAPAKRLLRLIGVEGSNPSPSAKRSKRQITIVDHDLVTGHSIARRRYTGYLPSFLILPYWYSDDVKALAKS